MPAVPAAMDVAPVAARLMVLATAGHRRTALLAELRAFCVHTCRDFRHIGNDVGAKPHRVRRAGLLDIDGWGGSPLGASPVKAAKQDCADRQCQPANEMYGPHVFLPGFKRFGANLATLRRVVDGLAEDLWKIGRHKAADPALQFALHENPFAARGRSRTTAFGQRSMPPSVTSAVTLSNDMWRQKIPSGIA